MIEVPRSLYRAGLIAVLAVSVFTVGCGKKVKTVSTPPSAPPPPAAAQPTVSLQASPTAVEKGDAATLSWTSTDATQLTIAPDVGTVPAEGQKSVTPGASTTYTITASGPGGSATASARITVATAAALRPASRRRRSSFTRLSERRLSSTSTKLIFAATLAPLSARPLSISATIRPSASPSKATATSAAPPNTTLLSATVVPVP